MRGRLKHPLFFLGGDFRPAFVIAFFVRFISGSAAFAPSIFTSSTARSKSLLGCAASIFRRSASYCSNCPCA